jgi:L,D-transpeptidase ErfK/SrfK
MSQQIFVHSSFRPSRTTLSAGFALMSLFGRAVMADSFSMPGQGDDLIGEIRHVKAHQEDTLIDIARRNSVGQDEMVMANPTVDRWLPKEGTNVVLPRQYILPDAPRAGIVVNVPEMRLYYYPVKPVVAKKAPIPAQPMPGKKTLSKAVEAKPVAKPLATPVGSQSFESDRSGQVITYPVSMGRMDWRTPIGKTSVVNKQKDPSWTPPASIKREHAAKGDPLPDVVPPGPDNPLGKYAMRLGVAGYLIHGTDAAKADGIGMRVTHGCMRLYNEDIARLFPLVPVGSPVHLVNQPVKLGWEGNQLYIEVSQPLDEDVGLSPHDPDDNISKEQLAREDAQRSSFLMRLANSEIQKQRDKGASVSMDRVRRAIDKPTGIPVVIGGNGSGWQQAGDEGLAPMAQEEDPNKSPLDAPPAKSSHTASAARTRVRSYEPAPAATDSSEEFYSPATPYRPTRNVEAEPTDRPADAKSSPYPDDADAQSAEVVTESEPSEEE